MQVHLAINVDRNHQHRGRSREAKVPALLEMYDIPYVASDPLVCAVTLDKATALNKKDIALEVKDGVLYLNDSAKVVKTDIECSNGVIHVIDTIMLPPDMVSQR